MTNYEDHQKQQKHQVEEALENLTEASSKHSPESKEVDYAKQKRALAEKELVNSRKSTHG